jgi:hypothetical protein
MPGGARRGGGDRAGGGGGGDGGDGGGGAMGAAGSSQVSESVCKGTVSGVSSCQQHGMHAVARCILLVAAPSPQLP